MGGAELPPVVENRHQRPTEDGDDFVQDNMSLQTFTELDNMLIAASDKSRLVGPNPQPQHSG